MSGAFIVTYTISRGCVGFVSIYRMPIFPLMLEGVVDAVWIPGKGVTCYDDLTL
jgi:hypothetical protein